jgi:two-component system response regulator (stage 0 sporulation protein A)
MGKTAYDNTKEIQDVLLQIGMPANLLGFAYLTKAVQMSLENPELLHHIMKGLYTEVATEYHSTPIKVERTMRHAIEVAWTYGDLEFIDLLFRSSVNPLKGQPTNSQFIARLFYYFNNSQEP